MAFEEAGGDFDNFKLTDGLKNLSSSGSRKTSYQSFKTNAELDAEKSQDAEAKSKEEQEAKARALAEQEAKARALAEQEAKAKAKAEQEAKAKAEQEAKAKAEQEAKAKAEQEAKAKAKAEQEAKASAAAGMGSQAPHQKPDLDSFTVSIPSGQAGGGMRGFNMFNPLH